MPETLLVYVCNRDHEYEELAGFNAFPHRNIPSCDDNEGRWMELPVYESWTDIPVTGLPDLLATVTALYAAAWLWTYIRREMQNSK